MLEALFLPRWQKGKKRDLLFLADHHSLTVVVLPTTLTANSPFRRVASGASRRGISKVDLPTVHGK
jgi:hypothetical protein